MPKAPTKSSTQLVDRPPTPSRHGIRTRDSKFPVPETSHYLQLPPENAQTRDVRATNT
jgi:hypothetical protein